MGISLNQYQDTVREFRTATANNLYAILGLAAEAGEVADKVAKAIRDGANDEELTEAICKELGDVLWFIAAIADDNDLTLEYVASRNIDKLSSRKARGVISGSGDDR